MGSEIKSNMVTFRECWPNTLPYTLLAKDTGYLSVDTLVLFLSSYKVTIYFSTSYIILQQLPNNCLPFDTVYIL